MTELEFTLRKIEIQKQWLWMLTNLSDEELQLPSQRNDKARSNGWSTWYSKEIIANRTKTTTMRKTKSKITAPQPIKEFAKDIAEFAKKANKEELALIESELKEMIAMIQDYKDKNK